MTTIAWFERMRFAGPSALSPGLATSSAQMAIAQAKSRKTDAFRSQKWPFCASRMILQWLGPYSYNSNNFSWSLGPPTFSDKLPLSRVSRSNMRLVRPRFWVSFLPLHQAPLMRRPRSAWRRRTANRSFESAQGFRMISCLVEPGKWRFP